MVAAERLAEIRRGIDLAATVLLDRDGQGTVAAARRSADDLQVDMLGGRQRRRGSLLVARWTASGV